MTKEMNKPVEKEHVCCCTDPDIGFWISKYCYVHKRGLGIFARKLEMIQAKEKERKTDE